MYHPLLRLQRHLFALTEQRRHGCRFRHLILVAAKTSTSTTPIVISLKAGAPSAPCAQAGKVMSCGWELCGCVWERGPEKSFISSTLGPHRIKILYVEPRNLENTLSCGPKHWKRCPKYLIFFKLVAPRMPRIGKIYQKYHVCSVHRPEC